MLLFCACDRLDIKGLIMPTGDAVNRRFEQSADIHKNMPVATLEAGATYNLFVCADPHIADDTKNLKEFLEIRDTNPVFDDVKARHSIGIPLFVREDGLMTLDINEAFSWIGQKPVEEDEIVEKILFCGIHGCK